MDTTNFTTNPNRHCRASKEAPDQKAIKLILASAKKKYQKANIVIIARYKWLKNHKLQFPANMELPNLCLMLKKGELERAFYSNVLTHVIKKQNYYIQVLN